MQNHLKLAPRNQSKGEEADWLQAESGRALMAAMFESSGDAILIVALDGTIAGWSRGSEDLFGYTPTEAIGRDFLLIVPADHHEIAIAMNREISTGRERVINFEGPARKKCGAIFDASMTVFGIYDRSGKLMGSSAIVRDVTAAKEIERQLGAAREEAMAASRAKSEFLSNMSHEIRTPMTAILGMAEVLADGHLSDEQRRYIEIMNNSGHALLELINSILDLAKVESGHLTLEQVDFDLREVIEKSAQTLAIRAHGKRLELIVSVAAGVPTALVGDPSRLRQVMVNLICNAIKFTERGEVLVSVERDSAAGDPLRLKFSVSDTRIGIAKEDLPMLFAAFSQVDSSTTRKYGGSSLGLAIVKRLVGLMGGEVAVQIEPGNGSTFSFSAKFEQQANPAAKTEWPDLAEVPILIVDDNQTARGVLRAILSARGAIVAEAASCAEGLAAIKQLGGAGQMPRIVLLDDRVPSSDARAPAQLIAAASQCGASIIAMIHCDNLAADISRLRSLKLETYLMKPIETGELAKALGHVLTGGIGRVPHETPRPPQGTGPPPVVDRPLKILFADDSSDNRILVRAFLKKTPYHLDEVENGREAIDTFTRGIYDVVLMDIQMPEVDGYAATRAIREFERAHDRAPTPIIALTASVFSEAVRLTRAAGCDAHVSKPVSKFVLLRAIFEAVRAAAPASPPPG